MDSMNATIGRAPVVRAGKHDEQRRRIDAAVVAAERDLAQRRHLAAPRFVQDLAGLGIARRVGLLRLRRGEKSQHAARDVRRDPQAFERRDDAVAAEGGVEPGHAGVGVEAVRRVRDQHVEIRRRAIEPGIELARSMS